MKLPLIILHGALGSSSQFTELAGSLRSDLEVHTLDFEGHGSRPSAKGFSIDIFVDNVRQYFNENSIEKAHIFGYSMGGYVALKLASASPEMVGKIMTLATKFDWTPESAEREARMLDAGKISEKVPAFAASLQERHGKERWKEVLRKTSGLMTKLGSEYGLNDALLRTVQTETLIAVGTEDKMVSSGESRHVADILPNGRFKELEGLQHPIETVDVQFLKKEIISFLNYRYMKNTIGRIIILVKDYDEALEFYQKNFGFKVLFDNTEGNQRYLHIGSGNKEHSTGIWFLKASGSSTERTGRQTGGEPLMVIYTSDIEKLYSHLQKNGVNITKHPVFSHEYKFLHCEDLYGNEIVVVEL